MARYCEAKDLRALVPDMFRDAALADSSGGAEADAGLLKAVLDGACDEVDALIEGRVRLPLETVPAKLRVAAANIALELLFIRRGRELPGPAAEKVQWWRSWLSKVGEGELRLDAPDTAGKTEYPGAVATRPSITGSGRLLFVLAVSFGIWAFGRAESLAVDARSWAFDLPASGDVFENAEEMEWSQGESLVLEYAGGTLEAGQVARWEVADGTNLWIDAAGEGNGWRWELSPAESTLPAGRYAGRVAVYSVDGGTTTFHRVAALQGIRVHGGNAGLAVVAPLVVRLEDYALLSWASNQFAGVAGDIATNAAGIAALEDGVAANTERLDGLYVVNAGGWHYPDCFTAGTRVGGEPVNTVAISTNTTLNAVETLRETTSVRGWLLSAEIERQSEFGEGVEWSLGPEADGLWRLDGNSVVPDGATADTVATGDVFRVTGRLGSFMRELELAVTGDNVSTSGAWQFDSWKNGSLAGSASEVESIADASSSWSSHVRTWPEGYGGGTNHVVAGWNENAWIQSQVFSAVSYHTDAGGSYLPVTLVTPRHGVVANHWKPRLGSNVYWVGISGTIHTNRVVAYDNIRGDLSVARLAEPADESDFEFPYLLPYDYEGFFYGCEHGGVGCKGVPVVSFNNYEMAWLTYWQCAPAMTAKHAGNSKAYTVKARGSGTAHGRADAAIGGDSGSPTFLRVTDAGDEPKWVLLGCFLWGGGDTAGGPIPLIDDVDAAISAWGDEERAVAADFEAWGYEKYNPGLVPW